jgi:hypothetical protein
MRGVAFDGGGKHPTTGKPMQFHMVMTYDLVDPAPMFTAADFTFTPPAGAKPEPAARIQPTPAEPPGAPAGSKKP